MNTNYPIADLVTLWRPTGQRELDLVTAAQWRAWPRDMPSVQAFSDFQQAATVARERYASTGGDGYVLEFDVHTRSIPPQRVDASGEVTLPAAGLVGVIREIAHYRGALSDQEFEAAEATLGNPLPTAWRRYLQGRSWFHRGSLNSGGYIWLYPPVEACDVLLEWNLEPAETHPGIALLGSDGAREQLVVDLRQDPPPVYSIDFTSDDWSSAILQAPDIDDFILRIEAGTFKLNFG